jgi:hypothetical protein
MAEQRTTPNPRDSGSSAPAVRTTPAVARGLASRLLDRSAAFRRRWLIGYWAFIFFLTHWPNVDDFPGAGWLPVDSDLVVHFCIYAGWAAAWCWVLAGRGVRISGGVAFPVLAGGAAYAVFDELTQELVGRTAQLGDFAMDMAGVTAALLLLGWWMSCKARVGR